MSVEATACLVWLIIARWPDKCRWPSILDLMQIHQFHLSRERGAEYRLALPRSEVAAGGGRLVTALHGVPFSKCSPCGSSTYEKGVLKKRGSALF